MPGARLDGSTTRVKVSARSTLPISAPEPAEAGGFLHAPGVIRLPGTFDPRALVSASQAAIYADVSVAAVCNWAARGHLPVATDEHGEEIRDARGRPRYRLIDVVKAERATAAHAGRLRSRGPVAA